eukprot:TRINITY_DN14798_c0_g1_i2.p1 TRINITY_DN14798_c0_g1~~TRINITY_DN14798_c0_g1_i2.p1  ORF type:complete len:185 (+),score=54.56 TRINITY_DN14798_c0_g1_i2:57-611(+)
MEYAPDTPEPTANPHCPLFTSTKVAEKGFGEDFVRQLMEKARIQARQLHEKEEYVILCERRILELYPEHPLPVVEGHIGEVSKELLQAQLLIKELGELKKKLARKSKDLEKYKKLNKELQDKIEQLAASSQSTEDSLTEQLNKLLKEKQAIEASLRAEILVNEEQRSHITVSYTHLTLPTICSV